MNTSERLRTIEVASDVLSQLEIDQTRPIDPFQALEALNLEVAFWRLDQLLGAIVPGDESGVVITTQRGASVQRYTGAHEIGHWFLDKDFLSVDFPLDTQQEILGTPTNERERRAQLFAAYFLMPLPLVTRTTRRYGVTRRSMVTPVQAYCIARDMHVSYEAACRHLENCNFISAANRQSLLTVKPMALKSSLEFGRKPTVPRRDVWSVPFDEQRVELEVFAGDDLALSLPENRTTGFRWMQRSEFERSVSAGADAPALFGDGVPARWLPPRPATSVPEPSSEASFLDRGVGIMPVYDVFRLDRLSDSSGPERVGSGGQRQLVLNAQFPGTWTEDYVYAAIGGSGDVAGEMSVNVRVRWMPEQEGVERRLREIAAVA